MWCCCVFRLSGCLLTIRRAVFKSFRQIDFRDGGGVFRRFEIGGALVRPGDGSVGGSRNVGSMVSIRLQRSVHGLFRVHPSGRRWSLLRASNNPLELAEDGFNWVQLGDGSGQPRWIFRSVILRIHKTALRRTGC